MSFKYIEREGQSPVVVAATANIFTQQKVENLSKSDVEKRLKAYAKAQGLDYDKMLASDYPDVAAAKSATTKTAKPETVKKEVELEGA